MLLRGIPAAVRTVCPCKGQDAVGDEILPCTVALHYGLNQVFRDIGIVGKKLFGVFRKAVAAVAEARVVIMASDSRIETDSVDDRPGIETFHLGICIQFIEIADPQCQVGICEQFHGLGFRHSHIQGVDIFFYGPFLQKSGKSMCRLFQPFPVRCYVRRRDAGYDSRRIEVIVQGLAFTQELREEKQPEVFSVSFIQAVAVSHGNRTLDHHDGFPVDRPDQVDDFLDMGSIEKVLFRIIVGRGRYDHKVRVSISRSAVQRSRKVELFLGKVFLDIFIMNRRFPVINQIYFLRYHIHCDYAVMQRQ